MSKPIFMTWKTYAKKLEARNRELKDSNNFIRKTDTFLNKQLEFPSIDSLIDYLKYKSEMNDLMASRVINAEEYPIHNHVTAEEIRIRGDLNKFKEKLKWYTRSRGLLTLKD